MKASDKPALTECSAELITSSDKGIWWMDNKRDQVFAATWSKQMTGGKGSDLSVAESDGSCFVKGSLEREGAIGLFPWESDPLPLDHKDLPWMADSIHSACPSHQEDAGRVQTSYRRLSTARWNLWRRWGQNWPWAERCTAWSSACGEWCLLWKWTLGGAETRRKKTRQFQIIYKIAQDVCR